METNVIQVIIQGGSVGLCLVALWIIYKITNGQRKSFIDALDRNTDALLKFTGSMAELATLIKLPNRRRGK